MKKHDGWRASAMTYAASWHDPADTTSEYGVDANESGVGVWHRGGPGPWDEGGRQYTCEEWLASGPSLTHAPKDAYDRIDAVARYYGIRLPKRSTPAPITSRASLNVAQPTAEEQRAIRLNQLFGKPGRE